MSVVAPGYYHNPPSPENRGYYFNMSPRFEYTNDENAPGAGTYSVSIHIKHLLYRINANYLIIYFEISCS